MYMYMYCIVCVCIIMCMCMCVCEWDMQLSRELSSFKLKWIEESLHPDDYSGKYNNDYRRTGFKCVV